MTSAPSASKGFEYGPLEVFCFCSPSIRLLIDSVNDPTVAFAMDNAGTDAAEGFGLSWGFINSI